MCSSYLASIEFTLLIAGYLCRWNLPFVLVPAIEKTFLIITTTSSPCFISRQQIKSKWYYKHLFSYILCSESVFRKNTGFPSSHKLLYLRKISIEVW